MSSYYRCLHCRGFYEVGLGQCKYCKYNTVVKGLDGLAREFPDREACRAIQIAEYEQLGPEAMADCMRPPADELDVFCVCIHCGPEARLFEAVEMRWMANERMWACPCTTCGGRGFGFDIHPSSPRWECFDCGKKWAPADGNYKHSNCKCPACGSTQASGMFDDEYSEEEIEAMSEEEYAQAFGQTRAEEEAEFRKFDEEFEKKRRAEALEGLDETDDEEDLKETNAYDEGLDSEEELDFGSGADDLAKGEEPMADDIDFPQSRPED